MLLFFHGLTVLVGHDFLFVEVPSSHNDTPHSVGLLWTNNRPVAETSAWQHTKFTRDIHKSLWDSNSSQSQQVSGRRHMP